MGVGVGLGVPVGVGVGLGDGVSVGVGLGDGVLVGVGVGAGVVVGVGEAVGLSVGVGVCEACGVTPLQRFLHVSYVVLQASLFAFSAFRHDRYLSAQALSHIAFRL